MSFKRKGKIKTFLAKKTPPKKPRELFSNKHVLPKNIKVVLLDWKKMIQMEI